MGEQYDDANIMGEETQPAEAVDPHSEYIEVLDLLSPKDQAKVRAILEGRFAQEFHNNSKRMKEYVLRIFDSTRVDGLSDSIATKLTQIGAMASNELEALKPQKPLKDKDLLPMTNPKYRNDPTSNTGGGSQVKHGRDNMTGRTWSKEVK